MATYADSNGVTFESCDQCGVPAFVVHFKGRGKHFRVCTTCHEKATDQRAKWREEFDRRHGTKGEVGR